MGYIFVVMICLFCDFLLQPVAGQEPGFREPLAGDAAGLDGLGTFIEILHSAKPGSEVELVILLDRSYGLGRRTFYHTDKTLVADIIKHHTMVHPDYVRLAVVTFAKDARTVISGIVGFTNLYKCQLFEGDNLWDKVRYIKDEKVSLATNISAAFMETIAVFETSSRRPAHRVVLLVTDGSYDSNLKYDIPRRTLMTDLSAVIYTVGSGPWASRQHGNIKTLASKPEYYAMDAQWKDAIRAIPPLADDHGVLFEPSPYSKLICDSGTTPSCNILTGYSECECVTVNMGTPHLPERICSEPKIPRNEQCVQSVVTCRNGATCVKGSETYVCQCEAGFTGRHCEIDTNECSNDVCDNEGTCIDGVNSFRCECQGSGHCGDFCHEKECDGEEEQNPDSPDAKSMATILGLPRDKFLYIVIPAIIGAILMLIFIIVIAIKLRKRPKKSATSSSGGTQISSGGTQTSSGATQTYGEIVARIAQVLPSRSRLTPTRTAPRPPTNNKPALKPKPNLYARPESVVPTAPLSRPDILRDLSKDATFPQQLYQNVPTHKDMSAWLEYMTTLMESGDVTCACVTCIDCKKWIASERSMVLGLKDVDFLYKKLTNKMVNLPLKFKGKLYTIESNDGFIMQCVRDNEYLFVSKTRQYLIIVMSEKRKDICSIEVDWIRNHIREQGM